MRQSLIVIILILTAIMLSLCCLSTTLALPLFFTQGRDSSQQTAFQTKDMYIALARQDASNAGISPSLFVRQIELESGFNPLALSPSGAEGIAQFMPVTAASLGINPWDPVAALNGAAHLMARYNKLFNGDYARALAAYNAGPDAVEHALNKCGSTRWMHCLAAETRHYIQIVLQ